MTDEKKFWIGFNLVRGIGAVRFQQIQSYFGDLSIAWQAPIEAL
jgi:DNA processing protein